MSLVLFLGFLLLQISVHDINSSQDDFVVLASDGLWDHVSNYEAVEIVRKAAYDDGKPETASDRLVQVRGLHCVLEKSQQSVPFQSMFFLVCLMVDGWMEKTHLNEVKRMWL